MKKLLYSLTLSMLATAANYQGSIDAANCTIVQGYVLDSSDLTATPRLVLYDVTKPLALIVASEPHPTGNHGFSWRLGFTSGVHSLNLLVIGSSFRFNIPAFACGDPIAPPPPPPPPPPLTCQDGTPPPCKPPPVCPQVCPPGRDGVNGRDGKDGLNGKDGRDNTGGSSSIPSVIGKAGYVLTTDGSVYFWNQPIYSDPNIRPGTGLTTTAMPGQPFELAIDTALVSVRVLPPATSTSDCIKGTWAMDPNFLYLCVATDTWRRAPLTTF